MKLYLVAIIIATAGVLAMVHVGRADSLPDQKFYDARGNHVGTTSRDSQGNERYYDSRGNNVGTSSPIYGGRNYYDPFGNRTGTSTDPFFRDRK